MKTWRIWLVLGVAALLFCWHVYDVATKTEQWPFSYYPMYARVEKKRIQTLPSLFAVIKRDGKRHVVRVTDAPDIPQIAALNEGRLRVILLAAWNSPPGNNEAAAKQVLADYIRLYESRRIAGEIDGPPMLEARLYKLTWRFRADGSRLKKPSASELLATVATRDVLQ